MIEGIKACLDYPHNPERKRIVFFMTDGFIGNDNQILAAIKEKVADTRLFSFGVGSSPNRSLLERMAELGHGTAQYIRQDEPAQPVITAMLSRISKPYLTDVEINWGSLSVTDVYPNPIPDLYSAQPLILFARYQGSGDSLVTLKGKIKDRPYEERIRVFLPSWNPENCSLAVVWAREKIKYLMLEKLGGRAKNIEQEVTELALEYNLMSQYTSFVAVDEVIPEGSDTTLPRTIAIPVPMPEGVSFTGVFGPPAGYQGDYVAGRPMDGVDARFGSLALSRQPSSLKIPGSLAGSARARSAARGTFTPMTTWNAPSGGVVKKAEAASTSAYGRGFAYMARGEEEAGLGLSFLGDVEANRFLQESYKTLHEKDKDLFNSLNQVYHGAAKVDEAKTNEVLKKLLSSEEEAQVTVGLNLLTTLARQKIKIDKAHTAKAVELTAEGKNEHVRSNALLAVWSLKQPVPLDILKKTARDKDPRVRMITAYALTDKKLGKDAEALITLLVSDKDHRVAALAIKAATEVRKMNRLIPALSDILLKADSEKHYFAILEAGLGLRRLAEADEKIKTRVQKIFVKALGSDYPASVGKEKVSLKRAVYVVALKTLSGYQKQDAYPALLKLASDSDKDVQTMAVSILAGYKKAASYLVKNVLNVESFLDRPELLATVVRNLRGYEPSDDFYAAVQKLLKKEKISARSHAVLRVALVEALFDRSTTGDVKYLVSLLRKDSSWKVRRAVLARLAGRKRQTVLDTALKALEDPHPVIKRLALAEAVAATAKKDKQPVYLAKLSRNPTPAVCDEILSAEGLSPDLSLRTLEELQGVLAARGAKIR